MKVLVIGLSRDRVENQVVQALHERGLPLRVIGSPGSRAADLCRERGIPFTPHVFTGRMERAGRFLIRDHLDAFRPDIVHALTNRALANSLLARNARPVRIVGYRGTCGHLSRFDPAAWMSYLHPKLDHIICVSDAVNRYLRTKGVPESRLTTIHKGHDPSWYAGVPPPPSRERLGLPPEAPIIGFLGNMRPVKGVSYLVKALHRLPEDRPAHLLLIGEIRDPALRKLIDDPRVHCTGFREDALALTALFDLCVMPSISREGLPKALLECMARSIPCIATAVGGMPEVIEHGVSGWIVPPRDEQALAEALETLLADAALRERLGRGGRERIQGTFHIRHTVEKTLTVYRQLA